LKVLGPHFQTGHALQVAASAAEGFLTMMSLTLGILFCSFGYFFMDSACFAVPSFGTIILKEQYF
jgi:hypothetical protein